MATGKKWTRDELLVALNLYHKLTFGQLHARNPVIMALADKLERGANSVAMKLCNLASLDPALKLRGIKGLEGERARLTVPCGTNSTQISMRLRRRVKKLSGTCSTLVPVTNWRCHRVKECASPSDRPRDPQKLRQR